MHTVIVGAGIAGLWLADRLGGNVTVVEAYSKPGGRVMTSKYGYELGAGRVNTRHKRVRALIRRFHLTEVPSSSDIYWKPLGAEAEPNNFDEIWAAITKVIRELSPATLATHTLRDLAYSFGDELYDKYPYRAETERMRADVALHAFDAEMAGDQRYITVREGLSAIIDGLVASITAAGGRLRLDTTVTDVRKTAAGKYQILTNKGQIQADRVIMALHATALRKLPVSRAMPVLAHLDMAPLTRIYAKYPGWKEPRTVTDSPLRYIIPVGSDVVMISYTDDRDTAAFRGLKDEALSAAIQHEVKRLYPHAPEPIWVRAAEWQEGTTYWKPGHYSPTRMSRAVLRPRTDMPELYCCGESFSVYQQAWMEGALDHAAQLWDLLQK